jgi:hypothetical protein
MYKNTHTSGKLLFITAGPAAVSRGLRSHLTDVSYSHSVASHPVCPSRARPVCGTSPMPAPCTVTDAKPVATPLLQSCARGGKEDCGGRVIWDTTSHTSGKILCVISVFVLLTLIVFNRIQILSEVTSEKGKKWRSVSFVISDRPQTLCEKMFEQEYSGEK